MSQDKQSKRTTAAAIRPITPELFSAHRANLSRPARPETSLRPGLPAPGLLASSLTIAVLLMAALTEPSMAAVIGLEQRMENILDMIGGGPPRPDAIPAARDGERKSGLVRGLVARSLDGESAAPVRPLGTPRQAWEDAEGLGIIVHLGQGAGPGPFAGPLETTGVAALIGSLDGQVLTGGKPGRTVFVGGGEPSTRQGPAGSSSVGPFPPRAGQATRFRAPGYRFVPDPPPGPKPARVPAAFSGPDPRDTAPPSVMTPGEAAIRAIQTADSRSHDTVSVSANPDEAILRSLLASLTPLPLMTLEWRADAFQVRSPGGRGRDGAAGYLVPAPLTDNIPGSSGVLGDRLTIQ